MKLKYVLLLSHLLAGLIGSGAVFWFQSKLGLAPAVGVGVAVSALLGLAVGISVTTKFLSGFKWLERALATGDSSQVRTLGLDEFDDAALQLSTHIQRWGEAALSSREQSREIERLVETLNRRNESPPGAASGAVLRQQLGSISSAATDELNQILACTKEIERHTNYENSQV